MAFLDSLLKALGLKKEGGSSAEGMKDDVSVSEEPSTTGGTGEGAQEQSQGMGGEDKTGGKGM